MLRGMVLDNFVHFKERFVLNFSKAKNCPNFFVGASSTGKTAVLELIRRCMDRKLNSSVTNRFNESETAYVFCEFAKNGEYGPTVISGMIVDKTQESTEETSAGNLKNSEDDEEDEEWVENVEVNKKDTMFHKVIMYSYRGEVKFCCKTYFKKNDDRIVDLRKNVTLDQNLLDGILDKKAQKFLRDSKETNISKGIKSLFDRAFAEKVSNEIRKLQKENKTYNRYPKVWGELEKKFVGILSMRGIGTFQWTKSRLIEDKFKSMNYEKTSTQAEIIIELIESEEIDKSKEEEIFKSLTRPNDVKFEKKWNLTNNVWEIVVKHGIKEFPLLKASVGIVEAKQFSLLMAHKSFQTICLEEPDRGMHPQMIERMKMELYREGQSKSKTVIVVTHSPYLIDSFSLENTFIFSRIEDAASVKNVSDLQNSNEALKIIANEDLKKILFSTKVLAVKKKSDKTVLLAIFRHCFQGAVDNSEIMSHQIISMEGTSFKDALCEFCSEIDVKCCLILDRDVYIDIDEDDKITNFKFLSEQCNDFVGHPISSFLEDCNKLKHFSDELKQKEKTFFWRDGQLEDFLLSKTEKRSTICNLLKVKYTDDIPTLKNSMKNALNMGLSQEKEENLATIIMDFDDIPRLMSFLKEHTNEG